MNRQFEDTDDNNVKIMIDMGGGIMWTIEMVESMISVLGFDPQVVLRNRTELLNSATPISESDSDFYDEDESDEDEEFYEHDEDDDEIVDEETIAWRIPLVLNFEINKLDRVPVLVAAAIGHLESLKKMLHFRSGEPAPDLHGLTPVLVAAACDHQHVVVYLKERWSKLTKVDS
mgnify:FL=1